MMRRAFAAVLALLLAAADYPPPQTMRQPQQGAARWFGDVTLTDQDGQTVHLYNDLMAGQVVVVNAFYTGCRSACPQAMGTLSHLQERLAIDGVPARFISITVDPEHDTPDRLALYARALGVGAPAAGPDWRMLSGDPATVHHALHRFGLDTDPADPGDHLNVLYMANLRTGLWEKVFSLAPLEDLERLLRRVAADDGK
jgi:protein SCO1